MTRYKMLPPNAYARHNQLLGEMIAPAFNLTLLREVDVSALQQLRQGYARRGEAKPSFVALVAKASARALSLHPHANRILLQGIFGPRLAQLDQANVGIGVALDAPGQEQAAYVAYLEACDKKALGALTRALRSFSPDHPGSEHLRQQHRKLVARLPAWLVRPFIPFSRYFARMWLSWCRSALIVSSPGKHGADAIFSGWPYSIGISFGMVRPRPFAVDGQLCLRPTTLLTMVADRRMLAGVAATRFLNTICEGLQQPALLCRPAHEQPQTMADEALHEATPHCETSIEAV